ncbi:recombinase family protein [Brevundimonas sp. SH203]|uniref:recombinase family protein n=1 Tax=Brevundimonas sp. SH203 TaxID=345167 RepID=UPI001F22BAC3|nr:recombinase family protein [Brevundimonas sp. SH203]
MVLTPGPVEEIDLVQRIYRMFVLNRRSEREIAALLNGEGQVTDLGRPWTRGVVHQILTNEKYIGNNVYNRVSFKLKKKRVANTPDMWVQADGAFEGIVDPDFFAAAQRIIAERCRRYTDAEMLERLTELLERRGCLSGLIIDELEDMPSSSTYRQRFGSLMRAYELVGWSPSRDYRYLETNRFLRTLHPEVVSGTVAQIERLGGAVRVDPVTDLLTINEEFTASLAIVRSTRTASGDLRWKIRLDAGLKPDITVAARMDGANASVRDYYLLPWIDLGPQDRVRLAETNGVSLDAYRFDDLDRFFELTGRATLRSAA